MIFWIEFVEASEVDAHFPSTIIFLDEDGICEPCGVTNFSNKVCIKDFIDLLLDGLLPILCKSSLLLHHRFGVGFNS